MTRTNQAQTIQEWQESTKPAVVMEDDLLGLRTSPTSSVAESDWHRCRKTSSRPSFWYLSGRPIFSSKKEFYGRDKLFAILENFWANEEIYQIEEVK
jgi:hypothetical protein